MLALATALVAAWSAPCAGQGAPTTLPVVWVLSTGGTISGRGATSTSLADYKSGAIPGEDLVRSVPEIAQVAMVKVEQIANLSSTAITTGLAHAGQPHQRDLRGEPQTAAWSSPTAPTPRRDAYSST